MWDFYCSQKDFNFNIFDERQDKNKKLKERLSKINLMLDQ